MYSPRRQKQPSPRRHHRLHRHRQIVIRRIRCHPSWSSPRLRGAVVVVSCLVPRHGIVFGILRCPSSSSRFHHDRLFSAGSSLSAGLLVSSVVFIRRVFPVCRSPLSFSAVVVGVVFARSPRVGFLCSPVVIIVVIFAMAYMHACRDIHRTDSSTCRAICNTRH